MKIFNIPELKQRRKKLRKNQTHAEVKIWEKLRKKQVFNLKFYRQFSINYYIADSYCPKLKLAIEIDGKNHEFEDSLEYDEIRTEFFKSLGIKVIRFPNVKVLEDSETVMKEVNQFIQTHSRPLSSLKRGV